MARLCDYSVVGFVFTSLVSFACSAPPGAEDDDGESVPEFAGALPGSGLPTPGNIAPGTGPNPGVNNGTNPPNSEVVGSGNVPIDGTNNTGSNNTGSNGTPSDPGAMAPPANGAGGSAMTGTPPANGGVAGSSMQPGGNDPGGNDPGQGQGGSGNNPPVTATPGAGCDDGAIFCEDFDGIALGPITSTVNGMRPDRTVSIVEEAGRGRVLQVNAGTGYGAKSGVFLDNLVTPNNSHFGRAFIRVAQFPDAGGDHWVIVEATQNDAGERVRPVGGQFSRWAPGSDGPSAQDWTDWNQSNAVTEGGAWECVEWQINGADGGNDLTLWLDGLEVRPIDRANFRLPAVNTLWLGWVVFQNGSPGTYDVRIDDLVLSSERIGCN
jgi:hypothetical protein